MPKFHVAVNNERFVIEASTAIVALQTGYNQPRSKGDLLVRYIHVEETQEEVTLVAPLAVEEDVRRGDDPETGREKVPWRERGVIVG